MSRERTPRPLTRKIITPKKEPKRFTRRKILLGLAGLAGTVAVVGVAGLVPSRKEIAQSYLFTSLQKHHQADAAEVWE